MGSMVRSKNVVTSRPEYVSLSDLVPSLQVLEPTALAEVVDQVYEIVLYEEVRHSLDLRDPLLVKVQFQFPKYNGVLEKFQGLLQARQVIERLQGQVCADEGGPDESGDELAAYHVRLVVACGLHPPPNRPLPCYDSNSALKPPSAV